MVSFFFSIFSNDFKVLTCFQFDFRLEIVCEKPNYEIGSAAKLSFAKKPANKEQVAAVWKLDMNDDEDELIDQDDLLEEEDKVKPDEASLRGKRLLSPFYLFFH